jgi:DNA-binding transcriptional MerR regulator
MRIGELADLVGVSTKAIRYYESLGLIDEPARTAGGYRDYGQADVERLRFVGDAQATGLTLAEIASVLELKSSGKRSCTHTAQLLERHLADVDAQIERLRRSRVVLAELADRARGLDPSDCTDPNRCQVIDRPSLTL